MKEIHKIRMIECAKSMQRMCEMNNWDCENCPGYLERIGGCGFAHSTPRDWEMLEDDKDSPIEHFLELGYRYKKD